MAKASEPSLLERLQAVEAKKRQQAARRRGIEEPVAEQPSSAEKPASTRKRGGLAGIGALLLMLLWKLKAALFLLLTKAKLLFGVVKLGKVFTTMWTMVLMVWTYAFFYGWPFAAGLVGLILVHELGHGYAARKVGLNVGVPVFIPFVGALIALKERPRSTYQEFIIAAGGPLAGSLGGGVALLLGSSLGGTAGELLWAVGYFTLVLNLFNLIPVWQLDGARMLAPVPAVAQLVGAALCGIVLAGVATFVGHLNPLSLIIVAVLVWRGGSHLWQVRKARRGDAKGASTLEKVQKMARAAVATPDEDVQGPQRWRATLTYFCLLAVLTVAVHMLFGSLPKTP